MTTSPETSQRRAAIIIPSLAKPEKLVVVESREVVLVRPNRTNAPEQQPLLMKRDVYWKDLT